MEGASALAELLSHGNILAHLNISNNRLCDEGAVHLASALQYNSGLERSHRKLHLFDLRDMHVHDKWWQFGCLKLCNQ